MSKINGFLEGEPDPEQYTPPEIAVAARDALGTIDLDPATTETVNRMFIRAKLIYTKETNGLNREHPWQGKTFINPPGGGKLVQHFWERLIIEHKRELVPAGIFLAFNIEFLQQSQNWTYPMVQWPFCIPSRRLTFYREKNGQIQPSDTRFGMASAIIYVGKNVRRFKETFNNIGLTVIPR